MNQQEATDHKGKVVQNPDGSFSTVPFEGHVKRLADQERLKDWAGSSRGQKSRWANRPWYSPIVSR